MQDEPVSDQEKVKRFDAAVDRAYTKSNFRRKNKKELKVRVHKGGKKSEKENSS